MPFDLAAYGEEKGVRRITLLIIINQNKNCYIIMKGYI